MNWGETIRTAVEALNGRRMRSLLTMLGILIGIAAVMLTVGLGEGARKAMSDQFNSLGSNLLIVAPSGSGMGMAGGRSSLTLEDAAMVADPAIVPDVAAVAPISTTQAPVKAGDKTWTTSISGTTASWATVRSRTTIDGRFFTDAENQRADTVAVLGSVTASELFAGRTAIGEQITIANQSYTVIGVLNAVGSNSMSNDDDQILVPMSSYMQRLSGNVDSRTISAMYISARDAESLSAAHQQITRALNAAHQTTEANQDFIVLTFEALMDAVDTMMALLTTLLGGLAAISLVVGGIGVMNIMLVSVSERVREIGLRKALGATPQIIRRQFLVEAAILGLLGGLLGVITGFTGALILTPLLNITVTLSAGATLLALSVSMAVGLIAGVYPAARAAKMAPIDALRSE